MSLESSSSGQRRRVLDDPMAIRALAHPLRLELLSIVGMSAEITTADAARRLDISHGLASHHLRQLAKYGYVERAGGKDKRERPWRATHTSHALTADGSAEETAAGVVLAQVMAERGLNRFLAWNARQAEWPADWREQAGLGQSTVYLTLDELTALNAEISGAIGRFVEQRPIDDVGSRPAGSLPVDFTLLVVPISDPPTTEA